MPHGMTEQNKGDKRKRPMLEENEVSKKPVSVTPKRKRMSEDLGASLGSGSNTPSLAVARKTMPLSERQQMALLMQMAAQERPDVEGLSPQQNAAAPPGTAHTPRSALDRKINKRNERGETPLHLAAIRGDLRQVRLLMKARAEVNIKDFAGWTPLHEACNHGYLDVAKCLLKGGAQVNAQGLDNDIPLHDAAVNGNPGLVKLLLRFGADAHQANSAGRTPLDVAANGDIAKLLLMRRKELFSGSSSESEYDAKSPQPSSPDSIQPDEELDLAIDSGSSSSQKAAHDTLKSLSSEQCPDVPTNKWSAWTNLSNEPKRAKMSLSFPAGVIASNVNNRRNAPLLTAGSADDPAAVSEIVAAVVARDLCSVALASAASQATIEPIQRDNSLSSAALTAIATSQAETQLQQQLPQVVSPCDGSTATKDSDGCDTEMEAIAWRTCEDKQAGGSMAAPADNEDDNQTDDSSGCRARGDSHERVCSADSELTQQTEQANIAGLACFALLAADDGAGSVVSDCSSPLVDGSSRKPAQAFPDKGGMPAAGVNGTERRISGAGGLQRTAEDRSRERKDGKASLKEGCGEPLSQKDATQISKDLMSESSSCGSASLSSASMASLPVSISSCAEAGSKSAEKDHTSGVRSSRTRDRHGKLTALAGSSGGEGEGSDVRELRRDHRRGSGPREKDSGSPSSGSSGDKNKPSSPKVPPLKIILPSKSPTAKESYLPYIVNGPVDEPQLENCGDSAGAVVSVEATVATTVTTTTVVGTVAAPLHKEEEGVSGAGGDSEEKETFNRRTLRSHTHSMQQRMQQQSQQQQQQQVTQPLLQSQQSQQQQAPPLPQQQPHASQPVLGQLTSSAGQCPAAAAGGASANAASVSSTSAEESMSIHPRKRKLRPRQDPMLLPQMEITSNNFVHSPNPYQLSVELRKQVWKKREHLFIVAPKPPSHFRDYLMSSHNYLLAGNKKVASIGKLATPPASLSSEPMRELFSKQEEERHKLHVQHQVEREKLILAIEQETLRVHCRAARAMANQELPLGFCTVLRDTEIYNVYHPFQVRINVNKEEERDRNTNRSHYNNRQFLSWLQDVDDKFEKIKEAMLIRQRHEAGALYAVQRMDWEWKLKECGLCDYQSQPTIDTTHVPLVLVSDDIDLLPA